MTTAGAVLTGGASTRMGCDKATLVVGGQPMAARVAATLAAAGCAPVWFQGGDRDALTSIAGDCRIVDDGAPGTGPVGAIASALRCAAALTPSVDGVLITACDLFALDVATVKRIVGAARDGLAVVASDGGSSPRWHLLSWWSTQLVDAVDAACVAGVTSYRGLLGALTRLDRRDDRLDDGWDDRWADAWVDEQTRHVSGRVVAVEVPPEVVRNANTPADLPSAGPPAVNPGPRHDR